MAPFKCPDCGVWWAGLEHRCAPTVAATGAVPVGSYDTLGVAPICTCHPKIDWSKTYVGDLPPCPVHRWPSTITYVGGAQ